MINEEVAKETCNLAVRVVTLSEQRIHQAMQEYIRNKRQQKMYQGAKDQTVHGKQTVKELIGQNQGVTSVDVSKTELAGFQKIAKKYGVDFAVVKDKNNVPPVYTIFFKARDKDAIDNIVREYSNKKAKAKERPSVLAKIKHFKELVAKKPVEQKTRKKVPTR